ncbi:carbohydrate-binding family 9-like protein [Mucilaginibacter phyllosphaerae]|uniref:Carbohydrate-binding domain-containing protein n=1 Tax=Mucilaginibacter phyllosphaerae TaxID=1812349 RepID=A0A4Y8AFW1_9SPHI|nr:carbohydrate-binding family 9-like protein [Mucilaginibacter phyllosphaerae]MBB3968700.1 hypothetical protein [Mucilaginibacter phyllosphaerae]TEW67664.1 hypothetical protein E2R65_06645 [Mucilaginibacter phyllosphaerae]GGH14402.1 hypothetical protein GCM10007352_22500 [Mucilaginibacter phyllosphaerae]
MDAAMDISIPYLASFKELTTIADIAEALNGHLPQHLQYAPWAKDTAQPLVSFVIAYDADAIYLKYDVTEENIKAAYSNINDPVYQDSCVEFFIAFGNDACYYNLEFNCIGTCRVQYGQHKTGRTFLPVSLLKTIKYQTLIKSNDTGSIHWQLTLCIPLKVFKYHTGLVFAGSSARVNFFKCGDSLPNPHFLCWNNIAAPTPEFHLSGFFKEVTFSPQVNGAITKTEQLYHQ